MKSDVTLLSTSKGTFILEIFLASEKSAQSLHIASEVCSQLESCLPPDDQKITARGLDRMWAEFHKLRFSTNLQERWKEYFCTLHTPSHLHTYNNQSLQVLLDRLFKHMISQRNATHRTNSEATTMKDSNIKLSEREENVVRYTCMSGYVVVKLLKKYRNRSSNARRNTKWKSFVRVLEKMQAESQPLYGDIDTVEDYSKAWSEHIDGGGLFHVKQELYEVILLMEKITRHHLHIDNISALQARDVSELVIDTIFADNAVQKQWTEMTRLGEDCSNELLTVMCKTWVTVRAHSFVQGCNSIFHKCFEHGTRKTLKTLALTKQYKCCIYL